MSVSPTRTFLIVSEVGGLSVSDDTLTDISELDVMLDCVVIDDGARQKEQIATLDIVSNKAGCSRRFDLALKWGKVWGLPKKVYTFITQTY